MGQALLVQTPAKLEADKIAGWLAPLIHRVGVAPAKGAWGVFVPVAALHRARTALRKVLSAANPRRRVVLRTVRRPPAAMLNSRLELPRSQIEFVVDRLHVGTSDDEVAAEIRRRTKGGSWTPARVRRAVEYAIKHHRKNRGVFSHVMRGIPNPPARLPRRRTFSADHHVMSKVGHLIEDGRLEEAADIVEQHTGRRPAPGSLRAKYSGMTFGGEPDVIYHRNGRNPSRMPKRRWVVKSTGMRGRTVYVAGPFGPHEFPPPPIVSDHQSEEAASRAADRYAKRWKKYGFMRIAKPYGTKSNPARARRWTGAKDAFGDGQRVGAGYVRFWLWNDREWKINLRSSYEGVGGEPTLRQSAQHYADEEASKKKVSARYPGQLGKWKAGFILAFEKAIAAHFGKKRERDEWGEYKSEIDLKRRTSRRLVESKRRRAAHNPPIGGVWDRLTDRQRKAALMASGYAYDHAELLVGRGWDELGDGAKKRLVAGWDDTTRRRREGVLANRRRR